MNLLQQLEDSSQLKWVGTCSALNASYAADGYARLNGMGTVTVTNAVGALSPINGIAGAYAEHVPVILIAGSIPLRSIERGLGMHHTTGDGTWDRFLGAFAQVTAAQARLTPHSAVTTIERGYMGKTSDYNDVATWAYTELPKVFRPDTTARSFVVRTVADLEEALSAPNDTLVFIETVMDRFDAPAPVIHSSNNGADIDYGPPRTAAPRQRPAPPSHLNGRISA